MTVSAWDGTKGGVLFMRSAGAVTVAGSISADGKGYRGGPRPPLTFQTGYQGDSYGGLGTSAQAACWAEAALALAIAAAQATALPAAVRATAPRGATAPTPARDGERQYMVMRR